LSRNNRGKVLKLGALAKELTLLRKKGKKIVFTNGCFDLLHAGHALLFEKAKSYGDILVVGLNSDRSLRKLKGPSRPLTGEKDRAIIISFLRPVDFVVVFGEDTPLKVIEKLRPDVLVKGGDYKSDAIVGRHASGRVVRFPILKGRSTTKLINKILESCE
jgi:rfaE bifunctional protein nucleotidyltransferase chain/domain